MPSYKDAVKIAKETNDEYLELWMDTVRSKEEFGCNSRRYKKNKDIMLDTWEELHGQIMLISRLFGKDYFEVKRDIENCKEG